MAATTATQTSISSSTPQGVGDPLDDQTTRWLLGWAVLITILVLISKTKTGYAAIYYSLTLLIFLLFVTQYQWIGTVLAATDVAPTSQLNTSNLSQPETQMIQVTPISWPSPYLSPGGVIHPV